MSRGIKTSMIMQGDPDTALGLRLSARDREILKLNV